MHLKTEQREVGKENFHAAVGSEFTRRDFLKGSVAAAASGRRRPGRVLLRLRQGRRSGPRRHHRHRRRRERADRRPHAQTTSRSSPSPTFARTTSIAPSTATMPATSPQGPPGLMTKYGWKTEDEARKHVKVYDNDYNELLDDPDVEGGDHRPAAAPARRGRHRGHEGRQARADRKADGPQRRTVQGDGPRRQGDEQAPGDRPSAALQHSVRQRRRHDQARPDRRHPSHPRPVAPRQPARQR